MPPMEWPIATIGPVGAVAEITELRSDASWAMVELSRELLPLSP